jgi:hypothetical protein
MDIFKFPLLAEIWGTISDWVMIGVTTVTAYFLYKTLQSQKDVQQAQNKLLEIEQLRVREDFKPILKFSPYEDADFLKRNSDPLKADEEIVSISVIYNPHRTFKLIFDTVEAEDVPRIFQKVELSDSENEKKVTLNFIIKNFSNYNFALFYFFIFQCKYQDIAGTNYVQRVSCFKYKDGKEYINSSSTTIVN